MSKVLIVDDDPNILFLLSEVMTRNSLEPLMAPSGASALELVRLHRPELVVLDIMMPGMDGYEVTRKLRGNPSTLSTPILMFTAKTQLDDKVVGFDVGADDYLTKPTHPSEVGS